MMKPETIDNYLLLKVNHHQDHRLRFRKKSIYKMITVLIWIHRNIGVFLYYNIASLVISWSRPFFFKARVIKRAIQNSKIWELVRFNINTTMEYRAHRDAFLNNATYECRHRCLFRRGFKWFDTFPGTSL